MLLDHAIAVLVRRQIAVSHDRGIIVQRPDAGDDFLQRLLLRWCPRVLGLAVLIQTADVHNSDAALVPAFDMGTNGGVWATLLDPAIQPHHIVITNVRPALLQMPAANGGRTYILALTGCSAVNHNALNGEIAHPASSNISVVIITRPTAPYFL